MFVCLLLSPLGTVLPLAVALSFWQCFREVRLKHLSPPNLGPHPEAELTCRNHVTAGLFYLTDRQPNGDFMPDCL